MVLGKEVIRFKAFVTFTFLLMLLPFALLLFTLFKGALCQTHSKS